MQHKSKNEELRKDKKKLTEESKPSTGVVGDLRSSRKVKINYCRQFRCLKKKTLTFSISLKRVASEEIDQERKPKIQKLTKFDPFHAEVLCPDVHYLINQHFTGNDFLQMSEVCPDWSDMVEGKITEKIELHCTKEIVELPDLYGTFRIFRPFRRIWQSLKQYFRAKSFEQTCNVLIQSERRYKNLVISQLDHPKPIEVLKKFSASLENLTLEFDSLPIAQPILSQLIEFPCLKSLSMLNASPAEENWIIQSLVASNIQLKEFTIRISAINFISHDTLRFVLQQHQMKRLMIYGEIEEVAITDLIIEIGRENCGLENIEYFKCFPCDTDVLPLLSLTSNLRELNIWLTFDQSNILDVILDQSWFPLLTKLCLDLEGLSWDEGFFIQAINTSINELELSNCDEDLSFILLPLRGLKKLTLIDCELLWTNEFVEFIAVHMEKLEEITLNLDKEVAASLEHYEVMKRERNDINWMFLDS
jgi:hypothetical protein